MCFVYLFCLFCFVILLWFVYLLLYVLCSLNQGIAGKEPCAQSILPEYADLFAWCSVSQPLQTVWDIVSVALI